jgi:hypothetical protein
MQIDTQTRSVVLAILLDDVMVVIFGERILKLWMDTQ